MDGKAEVHIAQATHTHTELCLSDVSGEDTSGPGEPSHREDCLACHPQLRDPAVQTSISSNWEFPNSL